MAVTRIFPQGIYITIFPAECMVCWISVQQCITPWVCLCAPISVAAHLPRYSHQQSVSEPLIVIVAIQ